jgi:FkbM family methyltransferase
MMMTLHSSFSRDVLLRAKRWHPSLESRIVEREVPVISLSTLVTKARGQAIDVLKIDTEGYDLEILKSVDLLTLSPRIILADTPIFLRATKSRWRTSCSIVVIGSR